jgi:hypothetical protein
MGLVLGEEAEVFESLSNAEIRELRFPQDQGRGRASESRQAQLEGRAVRYGQWWDGWPGRRIANGCVCLWCTYVRVSAGDIIITMRDRAKRRGQLFQWDGVYRQLARPHSISLAIARFPIDDQYGLGVVDSLDGGRRAEDEGRADSVGSVGSVAGRSPHRADV